MSLLRSTGRLLVVAIASLLSVVGLAGPASATSVVIAGAAMEGDLQLPPGSAVGAGYAVWVPAGVTVLVRDATVWLSYACSPAGPARGELAMHLADATLSGSGWQPGGDKVWQAQSKPVAPATSACGGRPVWVTEQTGGATFTGKVTSLPAGAEVSVRFHYRQTVPRLSAGRWSPAEEITASAPGAAGGPVTSPAGGGPVTSPAAGGPPTGAANDLGPFSPPAGAPVVPLVLLALFGGLGLLVGSVLLVAGGCVSARRRLACTGRSHWRRRGGGAAAAVRAGPAGPPSSARTRPR